MESDSNLFSFFMRDKLEEEEEEEIIVMVASSITTDVASSHNGDMPVYNFPPLYWSYIKYITYYDSP